MKKFTNLRIICLLISLAGLNSTNTFAKDIFANGSFIVGLSGIKVYNMDNPNFTQFINNYNNYFSKQLLTQLTPITSTMRVGAMAGGVMNLPGVRIGLYVTKETNTKFEYTAAFNNKEQHHFIYEMNNEFGFSGDIGITFLKKLTLGGGYTISSYRGYLKSYHVYPNGMISYAEDNPWNGIHYTGQQAYYGYYAFANLEIWRIGLSVKMEWLKENKKPDYLVHGAKDAFSMANYDAGLFTDGQIKQYIPVDPKEINNTYYTMGTLGPLVGGMFNSTRVVATLYFKLFNKSKKL